MGKTIFNLKTFALIIIGVVTVLSLAACGKSKPAEPLFALQDFPVLDGSTANMPLMAEVMSETCGISLNDAQSQINCTTTPYAWLRLASRDADILLVYEPAQATVDELQKTGIELTKVPIGRDGLVFIKNESNPVNNLTLEQIQGIYSGKITNWRQVGGEDKPIVAYQRSETSGSQALLLKLVMADTPLMKAPTVLKPTEMGDLIDQLASYNNSGNAIGYSVYYYASQMYTQPGLKFIAVNGVEPSAKTIADGSYPLLNDFYVAIRTDEPQNSKTRQLMNWILSDAGKQALVKAGYVPVDR